jgi:hypothetical protein
VQTVSNVRLRRKKDHETDGSGNTDEHYVHLHIVRPDRHRNRLLETLRAASTHEVHMLQHEAHMLQHEVHMLQHEVHMLQHEGRKANELE